MERFRAQRSFGSERFLASFSSTAAGVEDDAGGVELDEDEVFWTGSESPELNNLFRSQASSLPKPIPSPNPSRLSPTRRSDGSFGQNTERNFGILAALPEEEKNGSLLQRKTSISSSSSASASPSSSSSAKLIPAIPKPRPDFLLSLPGGKIYHQSAPVNVPVVPQRMIRETSNLEEVDRGENDGNEDVMLPPHEIVARASGMGSPMTTFSVLEGAGRTLKGRDLRRVRNAVWRQTGFLD
ncbi:hypothetical protein AXF42_Ash013185 [Apostasia shenzhenica]|uniref:Senescence regulator S40 n=1 Tax=Apostasia shenzhenica TaxID=1088818 RepID=A0A2I0BDA4_9ASPA|nr:hypothetical protein AXF42_Ash013185 [Apostasia shenzhenica]